MPGGQLVMDRGGTYFVEHRNHNSMGPLHRKRCYILPEAMTLRFYRTFSDGDNGAKTKSYKFPAQSRIYNHGDGSYEVVRVDHGWSVVIRLVNGVFVRGNVHGFTSSGSGLVAQAKGFKPGKRHRAPGHL